MEDIPVADIATHPFLTSAWSECIERGAKHINADVDEVTNCYRPSITANLIFYNMFEWSEKDKHSLYRPFLSFDSLHPA